MKILVSGKLVVLVGKRIIFRKRGVYADKVQRGGYHLGGSFVALKMICLFICLCFCSFYRFSPPFFWVFSFVSRF